jgi:hypothetical protein
MCDLETSKVKLPRPDWGCWATEKQKQKRDIWKNLDSEELLHMLLW